MDKVIYPKLESMEMRLINMESLLSLQKNVLNLNEVCTLTGLSKSHIYKLTHWQKIPYFKQAKHLYFDRVEVEAWLKTNRFKTSDELEGEASTIVTLKKGGVK